MEIPPEHMEIIETVANRLSSKFKFGFHEIDDMMQQARLFALEGLKNYDGVRPLENFLWTHVRNRLFNFKRNNYFRPEKPCETCPLLEKGQCTGYSNMMECDLYYKWINRRDKKQALMGNTASYEVADENETDLSVLIDSKELYNKIDSNLSIDYREDWLRLANGLKITLIRNEKLLAEISIILNGEDDDVT